MRVIINRKYGKLETLGYLRVYDDNDEFVFNCNTLELPYKGNQIGISCIPEGEYDVVKIVSPKDGNCFWVQNVADRDGILIHKGNYAAGSHVDTKGCILVGNGFADVNNDGNLDVVNSTVTLNKLLEILPDSFKLNII